MESVMYRKNNQKTITIIMVMLILCLIPVSIVVASALTDPTVGINNNSDLTAGMSGVNNSDLLLDFNGADWHINPSDSFYPIMIIIPLVFLAVAILILINFVLAEEKDIKNLIYAAVFIIIALAMLANMQFNINSFLGG
jgi:cytochrome bd-type quinol oxidase subunit 1